MRKNSLTKAFAAVAVSAIAVSSMATAAFAADYSGDGDAANAVKQNTVTVDTVSLTLSEAKKLVADGGTVAVSVHLGSAVNDAEVNATGLTFEYDSNLTVVQNKGKSVAVDLSSVPVESAPAAELEGRTALFLTSAETTPITSAMINEYSTDVLYTFNFSLPEDVAVGEYPIDIVYHTGDKFIYGEGTSEAELGDQAWTFTNGITNGAIVITEDPTAAPTTAAPTTAAPTAASTTAASTTAASTTAAAKTTAKATTTTAKKTDSPKTGVAGAGVAVAGLAIAAGTAFVLRKKED